MQDVEDGVVESLDDGKETIPKCIIGKDIRNKASGQDNSMIEEKEISLQEKIVYGIIDYIAGEDFRKTFIKHV